ncbi:Hypothetical protein, putative [Bodo saltans]|uniref:NACHT domain-containing protein n=1 Tax=Bodo saltans TaxID=75058 RepID=A0A0S4JIW1_BODSA|nr:Hypothetical protein, putative [Bodo saltans]|eukprot:CUG91458.1 Hypothetical protein, putative [Bodo saltans]
MSRRLAGAVQDGNAQFRVTQMCNTLQDAVMNGDQQNRMAMLKQLLAVDLNDAEIDQPLLIFEILLQTLAMPKAADLDCNNRVEIATHASRYLTIFFVRCGDRVTISLHRFPVPWCGAHLNPSRRHAVALEPRRRRDRSAEGIAADLVDRAIQMLEGELLSRLAALDLLRVAPSLARLSEALEEKGVDSDEIDVPEFDVDDTIETLAATLPNSVDVYWMHGYALMDTLMALCKLGMSVQRISVVLFGGREGAFDPKNKSCIAAYCAHGAGFFDSLNPLSNNWRIREKAVSCLIAAQKQTKNKGLRAAIASVLADRRMLEKDKRVSLILNAPELVTEFNEVLKKDWQERSDVYLTAIGELNAKISEMMGKAEQTTDESERVETQQQIAEAREYLSTMMERMTDVSTQLGKLDTINDKLTEFREEHAKQWQKFEQRFGAEMARLEQRREADQAAVMGKLDQIHAMMAAMQAGGGSNAEPVLQLEEIVAKLKAQYRDQELDMVMTKDRIPLEKIFIQLAVVESNIGGKLSEDTKRHAVPLAQMFRERKRRLVKKVLIVGKAGVGKTTLCKKFTFDWATGALWPQFRFVFVLKFRNVNRQRYAQPDEQHLAHALVREQLSDRGVEHTSALLTAVRDILKNHLEETLIVCDGYDESTDTPPSIIDDLFRCPNVIFTSRPYGIEQIVNRFDLHIENIGFTPVHIKEYVRMFFEALQGGPEGASAARALITFLDTNPNILVTSTVPVNLQLVCSLYLRQRDVFVGGHISIGSLYNKLVEYLIEGYFEREGVADPAAMDQAVRRTCGKIAFEGLNNSHVVLPNRLLTAAVLEEPLFEKKLVNLFTVGLIKPAIEGKHVPLWKQDGFFLHLTFQEFFAATWLAAHMSTAERHAWLRANKFTPRLSLTICFTMSILMIEGRTDEIVDAFGAIMEAPVDEARLVQSLLVLRAFDELSVAVIRRVEDATKAASFAMRLMGDVIRRGESDAVGHVADFMESTSLITGAPEIAGSLDAVLGDPRSSDAASRVLLAMGKYYPTHPVTLRAYVASLGLFQEAGTPKQIRTIVGAAVSSGKMERFVSLVRHHRDDKAVFEYILTTAAKSTLLILGLMKPLLVGASIHRDMRAAALIRDTLARNTTTTLEQHVYYDETDDWQARFESRASGTIVDSGAADPFASRRQEWESKPSVVPKLDFVNDVILREVLDAFGRERNPSMQKALLKVVGPDAALKEIEQAWTALGDDALDEALIRVHFEHHFDDGDNSFVSRCIACRMEGFTASEGLRQYWSFFVCHDALSSSWTSVQKHCPPALAQWLVAQVLRKLDRIVGLSRAPATALIEELSNVFTSPRDACDDAAALAYTNLLDASHRLRSLLTEICGPEEVAARLERLSAAAPTPNHALALKYQMWVVWCSEFNDRDTLPGVVATLTELNDAFQYRKAAPRSDPNDELDPELRLTRSNADRWSMFIELLSMPVASHTAVTEHDLRIVYLGLIIRRDPRVLDGFGNDESAGRLLKKVESILVKHPQWHGSFRVWRGHAARYRQRNERSDIGSGACGQCRAVIRRHWSHQTQRLPVAGLLRVNALRPQLIPRLLDMAQHKELTNTAMQLLFDGNVSPLEARSILLRIVEIVPRLGGFVGFTGTNYLHRVAFSLHHQHSNHLEVTAVLDNAQSSRSMILRSFAKEIAPPLAWNPEAGPIAVDHYTAAVATSLDQPLAFIQKQLIDAIQSQDELLQTALATAAGRLCEQSAHLLDTLATEAPLASLFVLPALSKTWRSDRKLHRTAITQYQRVVASSTVAERQATTSNVSLVFDVDDDGTTNEPAESSNLNHENDDDEDAPKEANNEESELKSFPFLRAVAIQLYGGPSIKADAKLSNISELLPLISMSTSDLFHTLLTFLAAEGMEGTLVQTFDDINEQHWFFFENSPDRKLPDECFPLWISALAHPNLGDQKLHMGAKVLTDAMLRKNAPLLNRLMAAAGEVEDSNTLAALVEAVPELLATLTTFLNSRNTDVIFNAAKTTQKWDLLLLMSPSCFKHTPLTVAALPRVAGGEDVITLEDSLVCLDAAPALVSEWSVRGIGRSAFLALMPVGCDAAGFSVGRDPAVFPYVVRALAQMLADDNSEEAKQNFMVNLQANRALCTAMSDLAKRGGGTNVTAEATRADGAGMLPTLSTKHLSMLFNESSAPEWREWPDVAPPLSRDHGNPDLFALLAEPFSLTSIIHRYAVIARQRASNFLHISQDYVKGIQSIKHHLSNGTVYRSDDNADVVDNKDDDDDDYDDDDDDGVIEELLHPQLLPGDDHFYAVYIVELFCKAYGLMLCDKCITMMKTPGNVVEQNLGTRFAASDVLPVLFSKACSSCTGQLGQILTSIRKTPMEPSFHVIQRFFESWALNEPATLHRFILSHIEKLKNALRSKDTPSAAELVEQLSSVADSFDNVRDVEGASSQSAAGGGRQQQNWKLWYNSILTVANKAPPSIEVDYRATLFWLFRDVMNSNYLGADGVALATSNDPRLDHFLHFIANVVFKTDALSEMISASVADSPETARRLVERMIAIDAASAYNATSTFIDQEQGTNEIDFEEENHMLMYQLVDRPEFDVEDIPLPTGEGIVVDLSPEIVKKMKENGAEVTWDLVMNKAVSIAHNSGTKQMLNELRSYSSPPQAVMHVMETVAALILRQPVTGWVLVRRALQDTNTFLSRFTDPTFVTLALATASIPSSFARFHRPGNVASFGKLIEDLADWCDLVHKYCTKTMELIDARRRAIEIASQGAIQLRKVKESLYRIIDLPDGYLDFIRDSTRAAQIDAATKAADLLNKAATTFLKNQCSSEWKSFLAGPLNPPKGLQHIATILAKIFCGRHIKVWSSLRIFLMGISVSEYLGQHSVGKFYSESMMLFLKQELDSDEWKSSVAESEGVLQFPNHIDRILRQVLHYWEQAEPLLSYHRQEVDDKQQRKLKEREEKRNQRVNTLMYSMWIWPVAPEDFRQRQVNLFPIRTVLDAVANAHKANKTLLETWLKDAAATICRAQQRALVFHKDTPNVFTFTEDNAVVEYTATFEV